MTQDPTKSPAVSERERFDDAIHNLIVGLRLFAGRDEALNLTISEGEWAIAHGRRLAPAPEKVVRELPAGMKPWIGGEEPPSDWDQTKPAITRSGTVLTYGLGGWDWRHFGPVTTDGDSDIIAYTPRAALAQPEAARVGEEKLTYGHMPSYGRCDFRQIREAVSEATCGVREADDLDANTYPGHVMVSGINYNSLSRIVTAFVDAAASTPRNANETGQDEALRSMYSDDGRLAGMDDGATFVLTSLAETLGVKEWEMKSGSEEWDGDVNATMYGILEQARVIDPWDNSIARHETLHEELAALATQPAAGSEG